MESPSVRVASRVPDSETDTRTTSAMFHPVWRSSGPARANLLHAISRLVLSSSSDIIEQTLQILRNRDLAHPSRVSMKAELIPMDGGPPIPITRDVTVLGRREYCDIQIDDPSLSKRHCVLVKTEGLLVI